MAIKPIVLVGPMGAGKSTIGRLLAQSLNCDFVDHDDIIIREAQTSIPEIFEKYGEPYFRDLEMRCLQASLLQEGFALAKEAKLMQYESKHTFDNNEGAHQSLVVIAGGGGIAGREDNRALLKEHSLCLYLELSVDRQFERVIGDTNRPMLAKYNSKERLQDLMNQRDPLYRQVASAIINSDQNIDKVVADCLKALDSLK